MTKILISLFLTWVAFDADLFRRRRDGHASNSIDVSLDQGSDELRQTKKIRALHRSVIPTHLRIAKKQYRSKLNYFSTKSRNGRDSDQRKIRRKFNNA
jgi:hypothetical protein